MVSKQARADVLPVRQQTQYNCVTTSLAMALRALGVSEEECQIERVNKVVGAMPLQGAAWEPMLAAANHYGMRATLTLPSTVRQLKGWTDAGKPVVIAWNPEGREWSHASLVFDVTEDAEHGFLVHIADPNIPDPDETVRVVPKKEFYSKWYEKAPQGYMIRRPACVIEREITVEGRQVMASRKNSSRFDTSRERREYSEARGMARGSAKEERFYRERVDQGFAYMVYALLEGYAALHKDPGVSWFATKNLEFRKFESILPHKVLPRLERESSIPENHKVFLRGKLTELHNLWRKLDPYDFSDTYSSEFSVVKAKVVDRVAPSWLAPYSQAKKSFKPVAVRPLSERSDKNVVDSALYEKFVVLDKLISEGFPQAQAAAQAVKDAYDSGGKPTDDQLKVLRNMMYRSKMRSEADQFRVASSSTSRVVRAYLSATPGQKLQVNEYLNVVLACLRAQALSYQTSHWQMKGDDYYGNHLLLMRLYESVGEQIDGLAEKMVGYLGVGAVDLTHQMEHIAALTSHWSRVPGHLERGLLSERDVQAALKRAYDEIKELGVMTLGLDDFIMATANAHDSNEYLLQQALNRAPGAGGKQASRRRRFSSGAPTAEKQFYDNPEKREVREFAETGAVSNSPEVAAEASVEDQLDLPAKKEVAKAEAAPPTPGEIAEGPGGGAVSTLNRFVVETEESGAKPAVAENEDLLESKKVMAAWIREIEAQRKRPGPW